MDRSQRPDPPDSPAARLRDRNGEDLDPKVSIEEGSSSGGSTGQLLTRLAGHAVRSPRYKLEGEIARGAMGVVLRVWDEDLRRHLAMKVVLGEADRGSS